MIIVNYANSKSYIVICAVCDKMPAKAFTPPAEKKLSKKVANLNYTGSFIVL